MMHLIEISHQVSQPLGPTSGVLSCTLPEVLKGILGLATQMSMILYGNLPLGFKLRFMRWLHASSTLFNASSTLSVFRPSRSLAKSALSCQLPSITPTTDTRFSVAP